MFALLRDMLNAHYTPEKARHDLRRAPRHDPQARAQDRREDARAS